ncbi:MAG TPA: hypothetical protein VMJ12_02600 [Candidatus Acidoferrales bacterium]|nr:hypothetical protein [Candidatus Acidoferrales bacterium]
MKNNFKMYGVGLLLCVSPMVVCAQSCTVNWTNLHQWIDGFGASSAWNSTWTAGQADVLFSTNLNIVYTDNGSGRYTNNGIGLSLLRDRIVYASSTSSNSAPSPNASSDMLLAQSRGARVWSTPWTPAAGFKSGSDIYDSKQATAGGIDGGSFQGGTATNLAYAWQLANYVSNMKRIGINLYAISIQNEPDAAVNTYDACQWSSANIHDFVTNLYNTLAAKGVGSTKIMLPESQSWQDPHNLAGPAMTDPNVAADVGIIADHDYDGANGSKNSYGKALWETEVAQLSGETSDITNGVYYARRIYLFMTVAQANAWHYWWVVPSSSQTGLMGLQAVPTKRMFTVGNYSRFVRPGYYRIDVSNTSLALISAYADTNSGNFAIVAVNPTSTTVTQQFNLANFPAVSSVTPWITSAGLSLASQSAVSVANGAFTYPLPAMSVVTFAGHGLLANSILLTVPASATQGDGVLAGQGNITLTSTSSNDLTVNLTSSITNVVTVPSSVVIPAGQSNAVFDLTIVNSALLVGDQYVNITAAATNYRSAQATILVHSTNTATLTVALPATANKGDGTLDNAGLLSVSSTVGIDYPVSLTSSDPAKLTVPATVIIPAGQTSAVFDVNIIQDNIVDGPQNVSVTAHVPNWTDGSASMTILDDNPLPDHFTWSIVPSPQWVGGPFNVTITAQDISNNIVDFRLPVTLSAFVPGSAAGSNTLLNSPATDQSATDPSNYPDYTLGYSFTVNTNLYVTHVRSYFGDKVSIWNANGQLLASQNVAGVPGAWVDTPLTSPLFMPAGVYRVAVHEYGVEYFWSTSLTNAFANGTINTTYWDAGDVFPQTADPFTQWYYVDLRYGTDFTTASVNPTVTGNFTSGIWSGNLAVLQPANNLFLIASAGPGSFGASGAFAVLIAPKLTISAGSNSVVLSWPTNTAGFNLVQSTTMSNWTNDPVTPSIVGGNYTVTNALNATSTYYRLRNP